MKHRSRELLFREAVLHFLGVKTKNEVKDKYCRTCKQVFKGKKDCTACDKKIGIAGHEA